MGAYPEYQEQDPQATATYITYHISTRRPQDNGEWWHTNECGSVDGVGSFAEARKIADELEARGWEAMITTQVTVSHLVYATPATS